MKIVIEIPEEKYEWIKKNNPNVDINSIVGAVAKGTPYEERPKGKWIAKGRWHLDPQCIEYTCSVCGRRIMREESLDVIERYPFCHCGADMRGDIDGM